MKPAPAPISDAEIRQLRVFKAVVANGGFTAAQAELGVSRSTISSQMSDLETRLGLTLCRRGRGGFSLTAEGRRVFEETEELLAALERFRQQAGELRGQMVGTLRIGVVDQLADHPDCRLDTALAAFARAAPDVHIKIIVIPPNKIEQALQSGQIEAAITPSSLMPPTIRLHELFREDIGLYCGDLHPFFNERPEQVTLQMIANLPFVQRDYFTTMPYYTLFSGSASASATQMEGLVHLILTGRYIGFLPEGLGTAWISRKRMRRIRPDLIAFRVAIRLAYTERAATSKMVQLFRTCILNAHKGTAR